MHFVTFDQHVLDLSGLCPSSFVTHFLSKSDSLPGIAPAPASPARPDISVHPPDRSECRLAGGRARGEVTLSRNLHSPQAGGRAARIRRLERWGKEGGYSFIDSAVRIGSDQGCGTGKFRTVPAPALEKYPDTDSGSDSEKNASAAPVLRLRLRAKCTPLRRFQAAAPRSRTFNGRVNCYLYPFRDENRPISNISGSPPAPDKMHRLRYPDPHYWTQSLNWMKNKKCHPWSYEVWSFKSRRQPQGQL